MKDSICKGLKGRARKTLLQLHRLVEFERSFDLYLAGEVGPEYVTARARKMLAIGLPRLK